MKLLKFRADWCGPCRISDPVVKKVSTEFDIPVKEYDADKDFKKFQKWGVETIPAVILIDDEKNELARVVGAKPYAATIEALSLAK